MTCYPPDHVHPLKWEEDFPPSCPTCMARLCNCKPDALRQGEQGADLVRPWNVMQDGAESVEMVEKEVKRLEVLKRRQERELNQLVQYELMCKTLQVSAASGDQPAAGGCCVVRTPPC